MTHLDNTSNQSSIPAASGESIINQPIALISREIIKQFCAPDHYVFDWAKLPCVVGGFVYATDGTAMLEADMSQLTADAQRWVAALPANDELAAKVRHISWLEQPFHEDPSCILMPPKVTCPECAGHGALFEIERLVQEGVLLADLEGRTAETLVTPDQLPFDWMGEDGRVLHNVTVSTNSDDDCDYRHDYLSIPAEVWCAPGNWVTCDECHGNGERHPKIREYNGGLPEMFAVVGDYKLALPLLERAVETLGPVVFLSKTPFSEKQGNDGGIPLLLKAHSLVTVALMGVVIKGVTRRWDALMGVEERLVTTKRWSQRWEVAV